MLEIKNATINDIIYKCIYCTRKESINVQIDHTTLVCDECQKNMQIFNFDFIP